MAVLRFHMKAPEQRALPSSRVRIWLGRLFREWTIETWRPISPASAKPEPSKWSDAQVTLAWIGHSTVLINFFGVMILTDPVLFPRIGIRLPGFTIGPKRLTAPALSFDELPKIDLVLLSHAHFDHLDLRTLQRFNASTKIITARATSDLLKGTQFSDVTELEWGQSRSVSNAAGEIEITAFPVNHWGARTQRDMYRGYNGYLIQRKERRIIFAGDTAQSTSPSCLSARTIRGSSPTARPSRQSKWPMPQVPVSLCRCTIKPSGLALSLSVNRSSASKAH